MPRRLRHYLPGIPAHIIQRGNNRQACFYAEPDYRFYLDCLEQAAADHGVAVHAYVLMTNHIHLLLTPDTEDGVSRTLQAVGRRYVQYINQTYRRTGTLWEGRHKASLIDSERYLLSCYRYIELNPVRAGMAADPGAYRWSSFRAHAWGRTDDVIQDHALYRALGAMPSARQAAYRAFVQTCLDDAELTRIRAATQQGLPLGNDRFRAEIEAALGRRLGYAQRGRPRKPPQVNEPMSVYGA